MPAAAEALPASWLLADSGELDGQVQFFKSNASTPRQGAGARGESHPASPANAEEQEILEGEKNMWKKQKD